MVLYFSGTGNSRYAAQIIADVTGERLVSINHMIKTGSKEMIRSKEQDGRLVFVTPTYAWRIPRLVEKFIEETDFGDGIKVYFVLTCGSETHNAIGYAKKLCKKKGFECKGLASVRMPENYIAMFTPPDKETAKKEIEAATLILNSVAQDIKKGNILKPEKVTLLGLFMSSVVNCLFYPLFVKAKPFYTTQDCTLCGKCGKLCPLNNIKMSNGRIEWGENCTHCMACICGCPEEAIEYGKRTRGKPRFWCQAPKL